MRTILVIPQLFILPWKKKMMIQSNNGTISIHIIHITPCNPTAFHMHGLPAKHFGRLGWAVFDNPREVSKANLQRGLKPQ